MEMEMVNDGPEREGGGDGRGGGESGETLPQNLPFRRSEPLSLYLPSVLSVTTANQTNKQKTADAVIFTFRGEGGDITRMFGPLFY